jgi:hypothetical protein
MTALAHHMPGVAIPVAGTVEKRKTKRIFDTCHSSIKWLIALALLSPYRITFSSKKRRGTAAGWKG